MKIRQILSSIIAAAIAFTVCVFPVSAANNKNENILTSEILKNFILSGAKHNNVQHIETLTPNLSGKISFSEPFKIPFYSIENNKAMTFSNLWSSVVFCNKKITALATFSYTNNQLVLANLLYLPYDFSVKIESGEKYTLFFIDADSTNGEENGSLYYAINSNGENIFLMHDSYTNMKNINPYDLKTDEIDYTNLSKYNTISNNMSKSVTVKYKGKDGLLDGSIVAFDCISGGSFTYNGTSQFIIHECGVDGNGEMTYSLSPKNKPKNRIKIAGSTKLYVRCAEGGEMPTYEICSAQNPNKVIFMTDKGKPQTKTRSNDENEQWLINIKRTVTE